MLALSIATLLGRRPPAEVPAGFSPSELFAASEVGVWYDPSDFSTLFQNTDGTSPVTAVEQPVGKMLDKSGNGFHATAANNSTARPVLKSTGGLYYLAFTTDDAMSTASIDFSGSDEMSVFAGVTKNTDAAVGQFVELSASVVVNNGSFSMPSASSAGGSWAVGVRGTGTQTVATATGFNAPITTVNTGLFDLSLATGDAALRVNGTLVATTTSDAGGGNFGNYPLYIGARNNSSVFFNGSLYSLIVRGKTSTATEIDDTEAWVANKTGVTL